MAKYHAYIDETGDFVTIRNQKDKNFVAGWLCKEERSWGLGNKIKGVIKPFNDAVDPYQRIIVPGHLHFMPLHRLEQRIGADSEIEFPPSKVARLVQAIFDAIEDSTLIVFRSTGRPWYYVNEQSSYFEILRATVFQLIGELDLSTLEKITITIAARRIRSLLGEWGQENIQEYERQLCRKFEDELVKTFPALKPNHIKIEIDIPQRDSGLAMADFFCGALRWKKHDYLCAYKEKIKEYSIHNAFDYINNQTVPKLEYMFRNDPVQALISGFGHLAANPGEKSLVQFVDKKVQVISSDEINAFIEELEIYLYERLIADPQRYQYLEVMTRFIDEIKLRFPEDQRVLSALLKYRIKILTHKGRTDTEAIDEYIHFLNTKGAEVKGGMYAVAQEKLETVLSIVQPVAFNVFEFEKVEKYLVEEMANYNRFFPQNSGKDENRARLEGTIGQMYGFLCDYPGQEFFFEDALKHLKQDVDYCVTGSHYWVQGMGYLTSLYFKKGDLDNTIQSFLTETSSENLDYKNIFDLDKIELLETKKSDFFLLHRLYVCALGMKSGKYTVSGMDSLAEFLSDADSCSGYPRCLCVKWLATMYAMQGIYEKAFNLLDLIDTEFSMGFTIDVIKLPIKIMVHALRRLLGKRSGFDLNGDLDVLDKKVPGIRANLERLGITSYIDVDEEIDFYELASLMPFYYS